MNIHTYICISRRALKQSQGMPCKNEFHLIVGLRHIYILICMYIYISRRALKQSQGMVCEDETISSLNKVIYLYMYLCTHMYI